MSANTNIEWTDATWNPVEGCSMAKGSEAGGCLNCYAARTALRRPASGLAVMRDSGPRWTGKVQLVEKHLYDPISWRKPKRIFVNSMSDLFHEALDFKEIDRVFSIMSGCRKHTFQVLTKRPGRMLEYLNRFKSDGRGWVTPGGIDGELTHCPIAKGRWPLPNVWLGVSVENQETADARIPLLLKTPAAERFVSYEPALGLVDFWRYLNGEEENGVDITRAAGARAGCCTGWTPPLDWVIIGGESGPGARPFDINWARQVVEQCKEAGVACFVKQLGAFPGELIKTGEGCDGLGTFQFCEMTLKSRKGGQISEWPEDLKVRQFPEGC